MPGGGREEPARAVRIGLDVHVGRVGDNRGVNRRVVGQRIDLLSDVGVAVVAQPRGDAAQRAAVVEHVHLVVACPAEDVDDTAHALHSDDVVAAAEHDACCVGMRALDG